MIRCRLMPSQPCAFITTTIWREFSTTAKYVQSTHKAGQSLATSWLLTGGFPKICYQPLLCQMFCKPNEGTPGLESIHIRGKGCEEMKTFVCFPRKENQLYWQNHREIWCTFVRMCASLWDFGAWGTAVNNTCQPTHPPPPRILCCVAEGQTSYFGNGRKHTALSPWL